MKNLHFFPNFETLIYVNTGADKSQKLFESLHNTPRGCIHF